MSRKHLILGALVASLAAPASAATYYVAQNIKSKTCLVVTAKPKGKTLNQVGTESYKSRKAAQAAMKAAPDCMK
jgi:hypothetical protein